MGGGLRPAAPRKSGEGAAAAKCGRGLAAFSGEQQGARSQRAIAGTKQRTPSHSEKANLTKIMIIGSADNVIFAHIEP